MSSTLLLGLSALALATALPHHSEIVSNPAAEFAAKNEFDNFKMAHGKRYHSTVEESKRFSIFRDNLSKIERLNSKSSKARFAVNKYADLTHEEFAKTHLNYRPAQKGTPKFAARATHAVFPKSSVNSTASAIDWTTKGAVSPVKDQGQCGSCWAFSAVEEVESAIFLATGTLPVLSPQQVTSCDKVDLGCNGGDTPSAYDYIMDNGLETEKDYPYKSGTSGSTGTCKYSSSLATYAMSGWTYATDPCYDDCTSQDENGLAQAISGYGPASICVNADAFQLYDSGILTADDCGPSDYYSLNHCVQIVGFDTNSGYWKVKNSWGTSWGEKGYVRLEFNTNACGVADEATFVQA